MHVTVAICTFNRARLLDQTLEGLSRLRIPVGTVWEVVVVNNNSSDETDIVVARHSHHLPVRCVFEARAGKSYAANLAVLEAKGDLILWTDDDVIVSEEWLAEYVRASDAWPDAAYFGGTVDPWFETPPPTWIGLNIRLLSEPYAIAQHGLDVFRVEEQAIVGANMGTRTDVIRRFLFDVSLGPTGTKALRGEETELIGRLRTAGLFGVWVGTARVQHFIKAERLTCEYLWHWYSGLGTWVAHREGPPRDVSLLLGAPRWAIKKYLPLLARYWLLYPFKGPTWLKCLREAALMRGYINEARRKTRGSRDGATPVVQER